MKHQPLTRRSLRRGTLAVGLALAVIPLTPGPAMAGGNVVTKANSQLHGQAGKAKADVRFDLSDRWAEHVRATAETRADVTCKDCHGAAVAFQVVVGAQVEISQSAVATSACDGCSSVALNYTFVVLSQEAVSFSSDQLGRLAGVGGKLRELDRSKMHANDIAWHADQLAAEVESVLAEAMESGSNRGKGKVSTRRSMSKRG